MKRIGFLLPSSIKSKLRGIGTYTTSLFEYLQKEIDASKFEIIPFSGDPPRNLDLVHYTHFDLFFHTLPLFRPAKSIVSILDIIPLEFPDHYPPGARGKINFFLQKLSLTTIDHFLTISQYSKDQINKSLGVSKSKITVTLLSARPDFISITDRKTLKSVKTKHQLPDRFVLFVGDVNWNKNLNSLTQACLKAKLDLVVAGNSAVNLTYNLDHPELSHFRDWLKLYSDNPLVHRIGFVPNEELAAIYNLATAYCQPSLSEGFGLTVLEAMACGTPVASSNRSSLPEVGGDAALYFNPENVEEIAQTLLKIVNDHALAVKLSQKGIDQSKKFTWRQTAYQTLQVYKEVLNK